MKEEKVTRKGSPDFVRYLWEDLTLEEQATYIKEWQARKEKQRIEALKPTRLATRYRPFQHLESFYDEMEREHGLQLDDDWYRLCALHKFEGLIFYSRERYEDEWLKALSKNYKATRLMKEWPRRARSKANPWKHAVIYEVFLAKIHWQETQKQFKVVFESSKGVSQTFWFPAEFKDSSISGWVAPVYLGRGAPYEKKRRYNFKKPRPSIRLNEKEEKYIKVYKASGLDSWRIKALMSLRKRLPHIPAIEVKEYIDKVSR